MKTRVLAPAAVSAAVLALALSACGPVSPHEIVSPTPSGSSLAAPYVPAEEGGASHGSATPEPSDTVAPPAPSISASAPSSDASTSTAAPSGPVSSQHPPVLGDGTPEAVLEGATLTLTSWGSSTCPLTITGHAVDGENLVLTAAATGKKACTMDLAPHTQSIKLDAEPSAAVTTVLIQQRGQAEQKVELQR